MSPQPGKGLPTHAFQVCTLWGCPGADSMQPRKSRRSFAAPQASQHALYMQCKECTPHGPPSTHRSGKCRRSWLQPCMAAQAPCYSDRAHSYPDAAAAARQEKCRDRGHCTGSHTKVWHAGHHSLAQLSYNNPNCPGTPALAAAKPAGEIRWIMTG